MYQFADISLIYQRVLLLSDFLVKSGFIFLDLSTPCSSLHLRFSSLVRIWLYSVMIPQPLSATSLVPLVLVLTPKPGVLL